MFSNNFKALSRTSLPCLLEDIRNMGLLNKILEARYNVLVAFQFWKTFETFPHFLQLWRYFLWHLDLIKFGNSFPHILQFQECKIIWETNCKGFPYLLQLWRFILWHFNLRYFEMAFHIYCNSRYDNRKLFKVYPSGEISYVFISDKCMQKPFLVVRSIQLQLGEGRARVWLNLGKFAK